MKYLNKSFSVYMGGNKKYEKNYDRIFKEKNKLEDLMERSKMKLTFGKYKGKTLEEIKEIDLRYIAWLATYNSIEKRTFTIPKEIEEEATKILEEVNYVEDRLGGKPSDKTEYIIERLGDIEGLTIHNSLEEALQQLEKEYPITKDEDGNLYRETPDPEDDRILIWEVLPSGHKKVVWHFSGWHWDSDEFYGLEQGKLPNDEKSLYEIAMEDI